MYINKVAVLGIVHTSLFYSEKYTMHQVSVLVYSSYQGILARPRNKFDYD